MDARGMLDRHVSIPILAAASVLATGAAALAVALRGPLRARFVRRYGAF